MAAGPPPNPLTTAPAPKLNERENESEIEIENDNGTETKTSMTISSSTEQTETTPLLRKAQDNTTAGLPTATEKTDDTSSLDEVENTMTALTLRDHAATSIATLAARRPSTDHDIDLSPIPTIVLTLAPSSPSSSTDSSSTIANPSPHQSPLPFTLATPPPTSAPLPLNAEHYPPNLPFDICPEPVNLAHPIWTLSMRLCDYSPASIKKAHYFTKSVVYYPDWKTRVISKNEHWLVPSSSSSTSTPNTGTDTATSASTDTPTPTSAAPSSHIATRPLWALQFYYGGPARAPWDEVIPASWTGAELDTVVQIQEFWIQEILQLIAQAQRPEVRADTGREVRIVSDSQLGSLAEGGGGDGGEFAVIMFMLAEACEGLEVLLGAVDAGGPTNWEAKRDLREGVRKYAARGMGGGQVM